MQKTKEKEDPERRKIFRRFYPYVPMPRTRGELRKKKEKNNKKKKNKKKTHIQTPLRANELILGTGIIVNFACLMSVPLPEELSVRGERHVSV